MREKRLISHIEKFQINYVNNAFLNRWSSGTFALDFCSLHCDFLSKSTAWKGDKKSDLTLKKPDKCYISQVIKDSIISDK